MKTLKLVVSIFLCFFFFSSSAYALQFTAPWTNIDEYALDINKADIDLSGVDNVDFIGADGFGLVLIDATTSTFTEYIVYKAQSYTEFTDALIDPSVLNTGYNLTFALELSGTVDNVSGNISDPDGFGADFTFTNLVSLDVYVDDLINGGTSADTTDYFAANQLEDFIDGVKILSGGELVNSGTPNDGSFSETGQGSVTTSISLVEEVDGILKNELGGDDLFDEWDTLAYQVDGDFTVLFGDTRQQHLINSYDEIFASFDTTGQTVLPFMYRSDIDADLGAIPEPATLALFGLGLLGMASISRRKNV